MPELLILFINLIIGALKHLLAFFLVILIVIIFYYLLYHYYLKRFEFFNDFLDAIVLNKFKKANKPKTNRYRIKYI